MLLYDLEGGVSCPVVRGFTGSEGRCGHCAWLHARPSSPFSFLPFRVWTRVYFPSCAYQSPQDDCGGHRLSLRLVLLLLFLLLRFLGLVGFALLVLLLALFLPRLSLGFALLVPVLAGLLPLLLLLFPCAPSSRLSFLSLRSCSRVPVTRGLTLFTETLSA